MKWTLPILLVVDLLVLSSVISDIFGGDPGSVTHWRIEAVEVPCRLAVIAEDHGTWDREASELTLVTVRHSRWFLDQLAGVDDIRNCRIAHRADYH